MTVWPARVLRRRRALGQKSRANLALEGGAGILFRPFRSS
jgi:hypothetical protein